MDFNGVFDTQTLFFVYSLLQVLVAVLLVFAVYIYKKQFLKTIAVGLLIEAFSASVFIISRSLDLTFLLFAANVAGIFGPLRITEGILEMLDRELSLKFKIPYLIGGVLVFVWAVYIARNNDYRVVAFFSWTIMCVVALIFLIPYKRKAQRPYILFLGFIHIAYLYPLFQRVYGTLSGSESAGMFPQTINTHIQMLFLISFVVLRGALILLITAGQLETALEEINERLHRLSLTDELTSLWNKRAVKQTLIHELSRHKRVANSLILAILDIDDFKLINDTYGHVFGDVVLKTFAETAMMHLRSMDIIGRFGGEEFIIIMPETELGLGVPAITRIMDSLRNVSWEYSELEITFSTGMVEIPPEWSGDDPDSLLDLADQALYKAKREGKDRVSIYPMEEQG